MSPTIPLSISLCENLLDLLTKSYMRQPASNLLKAMILNGYELPIATLPNWQKAVQAGHTTDSFKTWAGQLQTKVTALVASSLFKPDTHLATEEGLVIDGTYTTYSWIDLVSKFDDIMSLRPGLIMTLPLSAGRLEISKDSASLSTLEKKMIMEAHADFKLTRSNGGPHGTYWIATFCPEFATLNYDDVSYDHDQDSMVEFLYQKWEQFNANAS